MNNVYRQKPLAPDELLGHVEYDGKVYESRFGPDKYIGRVEMDTGKIFEARLGPDNYIGRVQLDTGKVFRHKPMAPDEYLGRTDADGKFFRHKPLATDEYIGKIEDTTSYAHGGAGFLLLAWPLVEEQLTTEKGTKEEKSEEGETSNKSN